MKPISMIALQIGANLPGFLGSEDIPPAAHFCDEVFRQDGHYSAKFITN